jgi:hypothetical protein
MQRTFRVRRAAAPHVGRCECCVYLWESSAGVLVSDSSAGSDDLLSLFKHCDNIFATRAPKATHTKKKKKHLPAVLSFPSPLSLFNGVLLFSNPVVLMR